MLLICFTIIIILFKVHFEIFIKVSLGRQMVFESSHKSEASFLHESSSLS